MSHNRERELESYPKHKAAYLRAFGRMLEERDKRGKGQDAVYFTSPQATMYWFLEKAQAVQLKLDGQIDISEVNGDEYSPSRK